jgi:phosphinothricin acetyltransferase
VTIRQAAPQDAEAIVGLLRPIVRDTTITFTTTEKTAEMVRAEIKERGPAYQVAVLDGVVVGFATFFPFRSGPGYARTQEHTIILSPSAHGKGMGKALMDRLCDVARDQGVNSLIAGVSGENAAGVAFHAAVGFKETTRLPEVGYKFGRYIDLVLMQKFL